MCLVKWSQKTKTFTMCGGWSSSIIISMPVKSIWSSSTGEVTRIACSRALTQAPLCWIYLSQPISPSAFALPHQATKTGLLIGTVFTFDPDIPHPYDTHSWPPLYEPQGLQTTELLPALQIEYGSHRGYPDGVWISSSPSGWPCPLQSWHGPLEDVWDPVLYGRKSTPS